MYLEFETRTSYKYLKQVISALEEPICILGGWAVFLHVNKNFQKASVQLNHTPQEIKRVIELLE